MEKLDLNSLNISEEQKKKLKELFPEVFNEDKIDFDRLKATLGEAIDSGKERYGLNWPGKMNCFKAIQTSSIGTLRPAPNESVNWDNTENMIIEGDNLEALKLMQKSYASKVKMIYIDPPYNTGNDFIYPDNYAESLETYLKYTGQVDDKGFKLSSNLDTNGRFHSNWLNMMYPRLFLARNLLRDDGAIIIHMDEHEHENLGRLLNEVFGEENILGIAVWDKRNPKGDANSLAYQHESIFFAAKNIESFIKGGGLKRKKKNAEIMLSKAKQLFSRIGQHFLPAELQGCADKYRLSEKLIEEHKKKIDLERVNEEFAIWLKKQDFSGGEVAYSKIDEKGEVYRLVSMAWPNKKKAPNDYFVALKHPVTGKNCPVPERGWRNPTNTMERLLNEGEIIFGADHATQPQRKYLLRNNISENFASVVAYGGSDDELLASLNISFDNPKPVEIAKTIISSASAENDIILDFFAGSGTTAHAVLDLNKQDCGNRKFILVQLPEPTRTQKSDGSFEESQAWKAGYKTIADITKERVRRVIKKLDEEDEGKLQFDAKKQDRGFKVFKLDTSNFKIWNGNDIKDKDALSVQLTLASNQVQLERTEADVLYELILKAGLPITCKIEELKLAGNKVYSIEGNNLIICLVKQVTEELAREIANLNPVHVVFLDEGFKENDQLKTNILHTLKNRNPDMLVRCV